MIAHRRVERGRPSATLRERGAAMVEFAIVAMLIAVLVFGALEFGFRWRYAHEAVGSSRAAARVGAGLGDDKDTDYYILSTVRVSLDAAGMLSNLDRVIIYQATSSGQPPSSCLNTTGLSGTCNVYPASMINTSLSTSQFNATTGCYTGSSWHQGWCSKSRDTDQRTADYIGVMVIIDTPSITKMFSAGEARRRSVMRMEPPTS